MEITVRVPTLPGASEFDPGPFEFKLARTPSDACWHVSIPVDGAGPEAYAISLAQERWVTACASDGMALEPVFKGFWRILDERSFEAFTARLDALTDGPRFAALLARAGGNESDAVARDAQGVPAYSSRARVDWFTRRRARSKDLAPFDARIRDARLPAERAAQLLARAQRRYGAHEDFAGARDDAGAVLALDRDNVDARLLRADAAMRANDATSAEADYRRVTELVPNAAVAWIALGRLALRRGEALEAASAFQGACEANPNEPYHWLRLGEAWERAGARDRALEAFRRCVQLEPQYTPGLTAIARVLLDEPDARDEAAQWIERALTSAPGAAHEAWYLRGVLARMDARWPEAIADLERCLAIDSRYVAAYAERGFCREALGEREGAVRDFDRYLQHGESSAVRLARARTFAALGERNKAIADLKLVLASTPDDPEAKSLYAALKAR